MSRAQLDRLVSAFLAATTNRRFVDVEPLAEALANSASATEWERAVSEIIRAYCMLRDNPHGHRSEAITRSAAADLAVRNLRQEENRDYSDWATYTYGLCLSLVGEHQQALSVWRALLEQPDLSLANKFRVLTTQGYTLYRLGKTDEAVKLYQDALGGLESSQPTHESLLFERQRLLANLVDHYLTVGEIPAARLHLDMVDESHMTPMVAGSLMVSKARLHVMQDRWDEAEDCALQALELTEYLPVRIDALGVRITVAGHAGRRDDLRRMAIEMAKLVED